MNTRIIDTADAVVRRYKTRNPEEIISQRAIKLKDIRFCHDLLGCYTVLLNCEYIGINPNCTAAQRISALAHELGHALFDRKHASSGQAFQDTCFYSLDNLFFAVSRMPHLLLYFIRHIDQSEPIEHPVDVSHSPDIPQRFRAVYHLSHLFHIP